MPKRGRGVALVHGAESLQGLARGLAILTALNAAPAGATIARVARKVDTTRAGARRVLLTLLELGYVRQDGHLFILTSKALELGVSASEAPSIWDLIDDGLEALVERTGEAASAAVLQKRNVLYVLRRNSSRLINLAVRPGSQLAAHATSLGWALLAELPDVALKAYLARSHFEKLSAGTVTDPDILRRSLRAVREQGYAYVENGVGDGLCGVAVALRGPTGDVVASINIGTRIERYTRERAEAVLVPTLMAVKREIEERVAALGPQGKAPRINAKPKRKGAAIWSREWAFLS